MSNPRYANPAADALINVKHPVLDHGFVALRDYMGGDKSIADAARISYQDGTKTVNDDAGLIDHLIRNQHTSPVEQVALVFHIKLPIFAMRQLIRHRTAKCLSGSTELAFDLPGGIIRRGNQKFSMTIKDFHNKWHNGAAPITTKHGNQVAMPMKETLSRMRLRTSDSGRKSIKWTQIVDIWSNGTKRVIFVEFSDGTTLRATADHPCETNRGLLPLQQAVKDGVIFYGVGKSLGMIATEIPYSPAELEEEVWRPIEGYEGYDVSSLGRVRCWHTTRLRKRIEPLIKKPTDGGNGYLVVSLSKNGVTKTHQIHQLVVNAFAPHDLPATRHLDSNRRNNRAWNLKGGTYKENAEDRATTKGNQKLCVVEKRALYSKEVGEEEVFDLTVAGDDHLFFANGTLVHNCNEMSGRYSVMPDEFYVPKADVLMPQSKGNKQGRQEGELGIGREKIITSLEGNGDASFALYHELLDAGLARELARINLPLSTYTEVIWQIDLHNLMKFLKLRLDHHAQYEIRVFAEEIYKIAKVIAPLAMGSFDNWVKDAVTFSAEEFKAMQDVFNVWNTVMVERDDDNPNLHKLAESQKKFDRFLAKIKTGVQQ